MLLLLLLRSFNLETNPEAEAASVLASELEFEIAPEIQSQPAPVRRRRWW
jgi:hypothetical protein